MRIRRAGLAIPVVSILVAAALLVGGAAGETVRDGAVQVSFGGKVSPRILPRNGAIPIAVSFSAHVRSLSGGIPPSLRQITLEVNRAGILDRLGLPTCSAPSLVATGSAGALAACGPALVGEGRVGGAILLPEQGATSFAGRILAFNATGPDGRPTIVAHLFSARPVPLTFLLTFHIDRLHGRFGLRFTATVPKLTRAAVHITNFALRLHRLFSVDGEERSYISAGCPAPAGFPAATFPLMHAAYSFVDQPTLDETLVRVCKARGGSNATGRPPHLSASSG